MSKNIRLHPTKGVNPKICTCPICGESSSLVLLGAHDYSDLCPACGVRVYGGISMSRPCRCGETNGIDREPIDERQSHIPVLDLCSRCDEKIQTRVAFILVKDGSEANPERLGPIVFVDFEQVRRVITPDELAEEVISKRSCHIPEEVWRAMGLPSLEECKDQCDEK